jgi:hypothetical protein
MPANGRRDLIRRLKVNNVHPKIITTRGVRSVTKFTSADRGDNVTVVAYCSEGDPYVPPCVIFKELCFREIYQ